MSHPMIHAKSSARIFGGLPGDYIQLRDWMDESKMLEPTFTHRALRHHSMGIFEAERHFGHMLTRVSDGAEVPVRYALEQHVIEDTGVITTLSDWFSEMPTKSWMARASRVGGSSDQTQHRTRGGHHDSLN